MATFTDFELQSLKFYTERIGNFDHERHVFSEYEKLIQPKNAEQHMLEWENRQEIDLETQKLAELKSIDSQLAALNNQCNAAREVLDGMRVSQKTRKEQIERLSTLTYPVEHDTTYLYIDRAPRRTVVGKSAVNSSTSSSTTSGAGSGSDSKTQLIAKQLRSGEIILLEKSLQDETQRVHSSISNFELNARNAFDVISRKVHFSEQSFDPAKKEAEELINSIDSMDQQCFNAVFELLSLRIKVMTMQREEVDELEMLHKDTVFFAAKEAETKERLEVDTKLMKHRLSIETATSTEELKYQLVSLDEVGKALQVVQTKMKKSMSDSAKKQQKLIEAAETARKRYLNLKRRYALEMEGYENEATMLRSKLKSLQRAAQQVNRRVANTNDTSHTPQLSPTEGRERHHHQHQHQQHQHPDGSTQSSPEVSRRTDDIKQVKAADFYPRHD